MDKLNLWTCSLNGTCLYVGDLLCNKQEEVSLESDSPFRGCQWTIRLAHPHPEGWQNLEWYPGERERRSWRCSRRHERKRIEGDRTWKCIWEQRVGRGCHDIKILGLRDCEEKEVISRRVKVRGEASLALRALGKRWHLWGLRLGPYQGTKRMAPA